VTEHEIEAVFREPDRELTEHEIEAIISDAVQRNNKIKALFLVMQERGWSAARVAKELGVPAKALLKFAKDLNVLFPDEPEPTPADQAERPKKPRAGKGAK
jgi:hypothetical protein